MIRTSTGTSKVVYNGFGLHATVRVTGEEPVEVVDALFHPERYQRCNGLSVKPVELGV